MDRDKPLPDAKLKKAGFARAFFEVQNVCPVSRLAPDAGATNIYGFQQNSRYVS